MELDKRTVRKILLIITFAVLLLVCLQNFSGVLSFFGWVFRLLSPFLMGLCIAFILNVPMRFIESKLFPDQPRKRKKKVDAGNTEEAPSAKAGWGKSSRTIKIREKLRRPVSMVLALTAVTGVIIIVLFLILPELGRTLMSLADRVPTAISDFQKWLAGLVDQYPELYQQLMAIQVDWQQIGSSLVSFLQNWASSVLGSTVSVITSVVTGVINFMLGLFFALYVLIQKEKLGRQVRRVLYAFLPEKWADWILAVGRLSNQTFSGFLSGQCFEAAILGTLFFISMSIFRFPYALMISVLVAFTALIPIFGAFIGCIIGAFLILTVNPMQAIWFVVMFIVIQQIEGNLIYPHVVGGSVGLPSMWVLVAVTVGGSIMGVLGMLVFIPLCSVIYAIFREMVNRRLAERRIETGKLVNDATAGRKRRRVLKKKS